MISVAATIMVAQFHNSFMMNRSIFRTVGLHIASVISQFPLVSNPKHPVEMIGMFACIFFGMLLIIAILKIRKLVIQGNIPDYDYVDGPKLIENNAAIRDANQKLKKEPSQLTLNIHPKIKITEQLEAANILVQGQSGVGKSTFTKPFVKQIYALDHRSFTYDEKGEYQSTFSTHKSVCLELEHQADYFWDIGKDIVRENEASLVAQAMISQENETQPFFTDAARQVFKSVIIYLVRSGNPWSWRELSLTLFTDEDKLKSILSIVSPSAATLIEPGSKTTQSIRSVLSTQLFWLNDMAKMQASAQNIWTVSDLINRKTDRTHIFFRPNYSTPDLSKAVCNSLITLIIERWLSRNDSPCERFWLLLDELGNLPRNPSLIRWLTLSRSKGGRTLATTQDISQLYECYGENITNTILSLFRTVIVMRLGASGPSAQKASDLLGQQRVVTLNQSLSEVERISISTQYHDRPVVSREKIINLPSADKSGVVGFLFIGGLNNIYKLKWPYLKQDPISVFEGQKIEPLVTSETPKRTANVPRTNRLNKRQVTEKSAIGD